jgi:peptidyl-prolyl cis-trans isomerase D
MNGGSLEMMGRGAMIGAFKSFEDELFKLKLGEVSGLVQTGDGYHIIKLVAVKSAKTQPLSEVSALITQRLKAQKASDKFAELAEKFSNTVYEQSDSLKSAAELVKVPVQQGSWLSKGQAAAGVWTDKALQAVFSDDVLKNKRNTAAVEVAPNTLLSARVIEYQVASVRPLAEVSGDIQKKLQYQQGMELMAKQGADLLNHLQHGEKSNVAWLPAQNVTRPQRAGMDIDLAKLIFKANTAKLPVYVGVQTAQNGYALARIDAVNDLATIDEGKRSRYLQQIRQVTGEELLQVYMADAKTHADISIKSFASEDKK